MKNPRRSDEKKSGGRPRASAGTPISQRWHDRDLAAIDAWRAKQPEQLERAEAIRRLVELGLTVGRTASRNRKAEAAARKMAAAQVDALTDPTLPEEERRRRKRRLIRRPKELRRRQGERTKPKSTKPKV